MIRLLDQQPADSRMWFISRRDDGEVAARGVGNLLTSRAQAFREHFCGTFDFTGGLMNG